MKPQEAKVKAIQDYPVPTTKKQIQSFLGSTGYYRKFIPRYSTVAACLSSLTKKSEPDKLVWLPKHQQSFECLKLALMEAPVLATPDPTLPYIVG